MSIQSTQSISREDAIDRLKEVYSLIFRRNYIGLESIITEDSHEMDYIENFFSENYKDEWDIQDIDLWTNSMIQRKLNQPFFRRSMFENYCIAEE